MSDTPLDPPQNMASDLGELLDFLPGVIIQGNYTVDGPKAFLYVSKGAQEVFGVDREQLLANSHLFLAMCHPTDLRSVKASLHKAVSTCSDWRHSWRIRHTGQPDRWVRVSSRHLTTLADGSTIRVSSFIEINREKKLEVALRKATDHANKANKAKSIFLANISHEIRTPLNGILGYAQLLCQQQELTEDSLRNITALQQCGQHLLSVINDVLDMARIESGRLSIDMKAMFIARLLADTHSIIAPLAKSHQLKFDIFCAERVPKAIISDRTRLRQVLINLLNNAVKFTQRGGVTLNVSAQEHHLQFIVQDTGCGIPHHQLDRIFERFERIGSDHAIEGTGLGLAITHHLVKALKGTITVTSTMDVGSTFVVTIPYTEVSALAYQGDESGDQNFLLPTINVTPPPNILVIDDDDVSRDVLCRLLVATGFFAYSAKNGEEAFTLLEQQSIDLILSDLVMPVMDGITFIKTLINHPKFHTIPCVAVSASIYLENIKSAQKAGFKTLLEKPVSPKHMFDTICSLLNIKQDAKKIIEHQETTHDYSKLSVDLSQQVYEQFTSLLAIGDIEALQTLVATYFSDDRYGNFRQEMQRALQALDIDTATHLIEEIFQSTDKRKGR